MGNMIFGASKSKPMGGEEEAPVMDENLDAEVDVYSEAETEAKKVLSAKLGDEGMAALEAYVDACVAKRTAEPEMPDMAETDELTTV